MKRSFVVAVVTVCVILLVSATAMRNPRTATASGPRTGSTTLTVPVIASADDAMYDPNDGVDSALGQLNLGNPFGRTGAGAFTRYQNVTIPNGATITAANIVFTSNSNQSGTAVNLKVTAFAADNPLAPTSYNQIATQPRTVANALWTNVPAWTLNQTGITTPDISAVIQEIVNRPGWVSGNAIVLTLDDNGTTNDAYRQAHQWDSGTFPAQLVVSYTTSAPTASSTATATGSPQPTQTPTTISSPTATGSPTTMASPTVTATGSPQPTPTATMTSTSTATSTPTAIATSSPTPTATSAASGTIAVTDPNWFWSPGTWYRNDPAWRETNNQGYVKIGLTGTTQVTLDVDPSPYATQPSPNYPWIRWHFGEGPDTEIQLGPTVTSVNLASGLSASAVEDLYLEVVLTTDTPDRWTTRANCVVRITGLTLDPGGKTVSLAGTSNAIRPKIAYIEGDSITEGTEGNEFAQYVGQPGADAAWSYAHHLGWLLNAEYGQRGWSAEDLINGVPTSKLPGLKDIWNLYNQGNSRLGEPSPDYVIINIGTNDATVDLTSPTVFASYATTYLAAMHTQWPNAKIFIIVPFGGFMRNGWQATTLPPNAYLIDLGTGFQPGLDESGPSWKSDSQKVHPTTRAIMELDALLGAKLAPYLP